LIPLEKLRAVKRLVTHASCPDGVASALIIKDALPDVEVVFLKYDTKEHRELKPESGTLFVDFSPWTSSKLSDGFLLEAWLDVGCLVLDHHPTQRDITMKFVEAGLGAYGENERGECGAWLAYKHVWLPLQTERGEPGAMKLQSNKAVRDFAELAGIRDTWKKNDRRWQLACEQAELLMFWGFDENLRLEDFFFSDEVIGIQKKLFEKKLESARKSIEEAHRFETNKGTQVLMFQGVSTTSDAAELLEQEKEPRHPYFSSMITWEGIAKEPDLVVGFHYAMDGENLLLQFSMRSHTGYDVGAFAKAHGGGGHKSAAGFTVEQSPHLGASPYSVFQFLIEDWESTA